jgi:hypothetical protein
VSRGTLGLVTLTCALAGCSKSGGQPAQAEKPLVGGLGKRLAPGPVADLKLTKDGAYATFLRNPKRPAIQGVSPLMALGELGVASLKDAGVRFVGQGVSNRPGSVLFSPDSRWLFFVDGYNAAAESGTLHTLQLGSSAEPSSGAARVLRRRQPHRQCLRFVDGGVLRVAPFQSGSTARAVATEVSTAQFTPDGALLLVHHRASAGGALERVPVDGNRPAVPLGDSVGDWTLAPDGKRVAFAVKSTVVRDGRDLWVAALPDGKPVRVITGTGPFAFSSDGMQLARIEREKASSIGNLVVGPAAGGSGRKVAERVGEFSFAPDGKAIAALANYDEQQRWAASAMHRSPGEPVELGKRVTTWVWSPDNKHLAFNLRIFQPLPSVDLWLYTRGKPSASAVMANVYGYDFGPGGALYLRSECIREARACTLQRLDPSIPDGKPAPVLEGIFGFRPSEAGNRMLVTYARPTRRRTTSPF